MIRKIACQLLLSVVLTACADGRLGGEVQSYQPARFTIESVNVDVVTDQQPSREFLKMMRSAAEETRNRYNTLSGDSASTYDLELSLEKLVVDSSALPVLPITNNEIQITAVLRRQNDGMAVRTVPVRYQLLALNPDVTREEQLVKGVLPKAFNGVYGAGPLTASISSTSVNRQTNSDEAGLVKTNSEASTKQEPVEAADQNESEPKVISCSVC